MPTIWSIVTRWTSMKREIDWRSDRLRVRSGSVKTAVIRGRPCRRTYHPFTRCGSPSPTRLPHPGSQAYPGRAICTWDHPGQIVARDRRTPLGFDVFDHQVGAARVTDERPRA